jgi:nitroreductase
VIVRDRAVLEVVANANPYGGMARDAQLAVIVCGDLEREDRPDFWVQDCAAATENLLLAAHAAGLGAVWCGTYPREERMHPIAAVLELPAASHLWCSDRYAAELPARPIGTVPAAST